MKKLLINIIPLGIVVFMAGSIILIFLAASISPVSAGDSKSVDTAGSSAVNQDARYKSLPDDSEGHMIKATH